MLTIVIEIAIKRIIKIKKSRGQKGQIVATMQRSCHLLKEFCSKPSARDRSSFKRDSNLREIGGNPGVEVATTKCPSFLHKITIYILHARNIYI